MQICINYYKSMTIDEIKYLMILFKGYIVPLENFA